ncbi:hypothetical protein CBF45_15310 [Bordetella sp. J329]|nr:hypothetical protein CBF45_15310 [Bordetella sp. J329]
MCSQAKAVKLLAVPGFPINFFQIHSGGKPRIVFMLPAFLPHPVDLAVRAFNALTEQEPWAREKLARHAGKRITLVVGGMRAVFLVAPDACLEFLEGEDGVASDVILTLPLERLALPRPGVVNPPLAEIMHISGEAGLAQTLAELARGLRWDAEDTLARWIGDVPAVRLVAGARQLHRGMREFMLRLAGNTAEYLSEETETVLGASQWRQWQLDRLQAEQQLDSLGARADAALRRLERLEAAAKRGGRP